MGLNSCLFLYLLIRFSKQCFAELISNLGFSLDSGDDCELYEDWCVQSSGYSSSISTGGTYGPNEECNITILYGSEDELVELWPTGFKYEVEVGLTDYFTLNGSDFSDYCTEYKGGKEFWVYNGTTLYWRSNGDNEYAGWRFCLQSRYDPFEMQGGWQETCECSGEDPLSNDYGTYCDYHAYPSPWCYSDAELCHSYRACYTSGDRVTWFFCEMTETPTTSTTIAPTPQPKSEDFEEDSIGKERIALFGLSSLICIPLFFAGFCYWRKYKKLAVDRNDEGSTKEFSTPQGGYEGIKRSSSLQIKGIGADLGKSIEMSNTRWISKIDEDRILGESHEEHYPIGLDKLDRDLEKLKPYTFTDDLTYIKQCESGSGPYLNIWLAHGPEESMKFAVKEFKKWQDMNCREKKALIHEIQHMIDLKHKNIVRCFGFLRNPIKIVYEYCEEGSYIDMRKRGRSQMLKDEDRVRILIQACRGLIYLVTQRIIHRNIAAENILLNKHLTAKISHFERIHQLGEGEKVFKCNDELKEPLIRWSAPETLLKGESSEASDVWAFGVTMWEVLTDQEPYSELEQSDVKDAILYDDFRLDLSDIRQESLQDLLDRCWYKKPNRRPTMKDIGQFLTTKVTEVRLENRSHCIKRMSDPDLQIIDQFSDIAPRSGSTVRLTDANTQMVSQPSDVDRGTATTNDNDSNSTKSSRDSVFKIKSLDDGVVYTVLTQPTTSN